ncbi:MAG: hypothetical protein M3N50_06560 [Pseudomonadota bacterium]|nr:hypothetical protein [Pseudomonadota bacterium]
MTAFAALNHGWKFGADGLCSERPAEGTTGNIAIKTYPTREFLGLVYVYIGAGPEPVFPPYPAFTVEGIVETTPQLFPCNYFQSWENDWDLFHAEWAHKTGEIHGQLLHSLHAGNGALADSYVQ